MIETVGHYLLDLMAVMILSMVFHELGHYFVYAFDHPGKARIIFEGRKLYTELVGVSNVSANTIITSAIVGIGLGFLPIAIYASNIESTYGFLILLSLWMSRHDLVSIWRLKNEIKSGN